MQPLRLPILVCALLVAWWRHVSLIGRRLSRSGRMRQQADDDRHPLSLLIPLT